MTIQSLINTSTRFRLLFVGCALLFAFAIHAVTVTVQGRMNKTPALKTSVSGISVDSDDLKIKVHRLNIDTSDRSNGLGGDQNIRFNGGGESIPYFFLRDKNKTDIEFGKRVVGAWYSVAGRPENMRDMNYIGVVVKDDNKVQFYCNNNKPVGPYLIDISVLYVE